MKQHQFEHWSEIKYLKDIVKNPMIQVGEYSYYSGYYDNHDFEDGCVRYLWGDEKSRKLFNPIEDHGWHIDKLIIGNYVCIASGVIILMGGNHNHHPEWITVYPFVEQIETSYAPKGDTVIESDAWIGMNAMIMPGVTIGEGAIVAAGSVVAKDVPPYTIVGGNPAQQIKKRFTDEEIEKLKEMRWFDWEREKIEQVSHILSSSSVNQLYDFYQKEINHNV
ncbi:CatB-related O-acetyltransferase [Paenibacillus sp. DMB20]|uniref:CatB-related O-acetyltransferase n=1 Tax=Paenibacillus sp. DMB20 TaxID=1642570 RepID=UPI00062807CC|nr:CatB-related O-acetyltransferase [Paenibacillus sp. DMB20]KKO52229.1 chloramphenicol acetyltransferase [Paenibacillus sp. DMB20]